MDSMTPSVGSGVTPETPESGLPRRNFAVEAAAVVIGAVVVLVPFVTGLFFFFDPLRKRGGSGGGEGFIKLAMLEALPEDGQPVNVQVRADRVDAWSNSPNEPVGAVFLRRTAQGVVAFNVTCPHLGCSVDYKPAEKSFACPCHDSNFSVDGERTNKIPPRGLDALEVDPEKLKSGEVWVKFQNFRTGEAHKIPKT